MNRFALVGDKWIGGLSGYGEHLECLFLLENPEKAWEFTRFQSEGLTFEDVFKGSPQHVIGKNPAIILLSLGFQDFKNGCTRSVTLESAGKVFSLLLDKTHGELYVTNLCSPLVHGDDELVEKSLEFNQALAGLRHPGLRLIDVDASVAKFIEAHRNTRGEARSLRTAQGLTCLGKLLLSSIVYEGIMNLQTRSDG